MSEPQPTSTEPTVLVVEDDQEINELLGEYLTLEQIRYVQALTGQAGLQAAAAQHPDAVILDLMLPDVDGYAVARELSTHRATFDIPVLMLTCMNQDCDRQKGFASGALHYMNKPFLPDDLLQALHKALEWKKSLATRTPQGRILVSANEPLETLRQLNQMIADLFSHTALSDAAVGQVREAFESLIGWALEWGQKNNQDPQLQVDYRFFSDGELATGKPASAVEWTLSEQSPGLLAAAFFKASAPAPSSGGGPLSIAGSLTNWALGRSSNNQASQAATSSANSVPSAAGTAANWFQFLGKTGAAHFERDSAAQTVRLTRNLGQDATVPVVAADGSRCFPHRLREEALAAKRK